MDAKANPRKLDQTIKDYLVTYGFGVEYLRLVARGAAVKDSYYLTARVFTERYLFGSREKAGDYMRQRGVDVEWGKLDSELEDVLRGWWKRRRLLTRHIPLSHLPIKEGCAYWFNARLSFAQIAALSLQSWVQEIRTVTIPADLVKSGIPMLTESAIAKALVRSK